MSDAKLYLKIMQDPVTKKGFITTPKTLSEAKKEIKEKLIQHRRKKPESETLAIEINGEFAGYVEINHLNRRHHEHQGNVGYCLHPKYRGKGITTKALKIFTNYAFKKYKLKRIDGWCRTFNKASARVLEKAGYKLEGILRKNKKIRGKYLDDMIWAKVK